MTGGRRRISGKGRSEKSIFSRNIQNPTQRPEATAFFAVRQNFSGSFPNSGKRRTTRRDASTEVDDAQPARADMHMRAKKTSHEDPNKKASRCSSPFLAFRLR
jgi:hypothetical protein